MKLRENWENEWLPESEYTFTVSPCWGVFCRIKELNTKRDWEIWKWRERGKSKNYYAGWESVDHGKADTTELAKELVVEAVAKIAGKNPESKEEESSPDNPHHALFKAITEFRVAATLLHSNWIISEFKNLETDVDWDVWEQSEQGQVNSRFEAALVNLRKTVKRNNIVSRETLPRTVTVLTEDSK